MPAPSVLCLLAALLAAADAQGTAGSCYQCKSRSAGACAGGPQPCPLGQGACLSVWEANTLVKGGMENTGYSYSCASSAIPSRNISLFFGNETLYVKIQSRVCTTNGCNDVISPVWPTINTVHTGGRCPICFAPGRSSCSSKETLPCEGRASQCITISGEISEDDITIPFAAKGCATPHACTLEKGVSLDSGVFTYKITQTECYTPSGAPRILGPFVLGSILPSLAGLLAVKFLS